jgi:hypothetical protein
MKWNHFRFPKIWNPIRRRPIHRATLALEQLECRFAPSGSSTNVVTYHNDNNSTGQNLTETLLTPANVNATDFGKLFSTSLDGQAYAQPLYMAGLTIAGTTNNVVFIATQHDSLYAIDANGGAVLWKDSLLTPVYGGTVTTVPSSEVGSTDISVEIGITSTPVIDPSTNIIYVEAKTKEVVNGSNHYIHQLHAINILDGSEQLGGPAIIADSIGDTYVSGPTVNGTGAGSSGGVVYFDALRQLNRPALTLVNGSVYLAFASHGDNGPYHGWIVGYSASSLALDAVFNTTPNGSDGGIWQSGGRLAVDAQNNFYVETGNGTFETTMTNGFPSRGDYGDTFLKVALDPTTSATHQNINGWGLKVVDYFTPFDQANLNNGDFDLGSGAPLLLPDSAGSAAHPHLLVGSGKEGRIYLIDRDNMGNFSSTSDNVVQETPNDTISGSFDTPAYFNGSIYYVGGSNIGNPNDVGKSFSISNGMLSTSPTSQGTDSYGYPGSTPSISASGPSNGVVWDLDKGTGELRAYDASSYAKELYTSDQAVNGRDHLGTAVKFSVPTVADGQVIVGTFTALVVYGLLSHATAPPSTPSDLVATALSGTAIGLTWTDNSSSPNTAAGFDIEESTDGITFTQVATANAGSTSYTVSGLQLSTTYTFRIRAFNVVGPSTYSNTASATTTSQAPLLDFTSGFGSAGSLLTYNGMAIVNGTSVELTDGNSNEAGSVFSTNAVDVTHFTTQFSFQLVNGTNPSADGITFCIQENGPTALGPGGGGLGYGPDNTGGTGGIPNSIAIKFDLHSNQGEGLDSTGLYTNGVAPTVPSIDLTGTGIDLHSQDQFSVTITYAGPALEVTIADRSTGASTSQTYSIDIPATVGSGTAYVGFTGGSGGESAIQNILTWTYSPTSSNVPAAPSSLTAAAASGTQVNLAWTSNSTNQTGYQIDRATDSGFTQNLVTQTASASATSFVDTGLTPGTTYYYQVRAINAAGSSANSDAVSVILPVPPAAVSNLQILRVTTNEVDLQWENNAANATDIEVFRQNGSNSPILIADLPPTATSLADTGLVTALTPGTHYTYNVQAVNLAGPSFITSISTTTALAPGNLVLAVNAGGGASGVFAGDGDFTGGFVSQATQAIDTSKVKDAAPQAVYQTWRYGNFLYSVPNLTAGATYVVRLDFAEDSPTVTAAGQRVFNVLINGMQVLTNFDVFAAAGGQLKSIEKQFTVTANTSGKINILFKTVVGAARVNGIEVFASNLNFSDFSGAGSRLTLNGSTALNGNKLELTNGGTNQAGSAFTTNQVNVVSFTTHFSFQLTNPNAEGFAFVIQGNSPTALGQSGGGLGYGASSTGGTGGIPNCIALKFDLNNNQGEGGDSTGLYINGVAPTNRGSIDLSSTGINFHSGDLFNVGLTYEGTTLRETITDVSTHATVTEAYQINIPAIVGGGPAFVGFTGSTGSQTATQDILSWKYISTSI